MGDIEKTGGLGSSALERVGQLDMALQDRLVTLLPEAISPEGGIDWKTVGGLQLSRPVGAVVMAHAVPDVLADYARTIAEAEARGLTDKAVELLDEADAIQKVAISVLDIATQSLYAEDSHSDGVITRREGGVVANGQILREFSDVMTLRLQQTRITTETMPQFVETIVLPMVELVRDGFIPEAALAIIDLAAELASPIEAVVKAAQMYQFDLSDEFDRNRLHTLSLYAGNIEHIGNHISRTTGEIDPQVFEEDVVTVEVLEDEESLVVIAADEEPEAGLSDDWEEEELEEEKAAQVAEEFDDLEMPGEIDDLIRHTLGHSTQAETD